MNKRDATKYILIQLCDWYFELNPSRKDTKINDLSILKVLKLLFFISTIKYNKRDLLEDTFNEFKAMPLGPVETGVYNFFRESPNIINYTKTNYTQLKASPIDLSNEDKEFIEKLVNSLKEKNSDLINKGPYYLVDLSHEWTCWIERYQEALDLNIRAKEMTARDIRESKGRLYTF